MSKNFQYKSPGKYVAICNNSRFDGHYTKVFDFPDPEDKSVTIKDDEVHWTDEPTEQAITASWYFLNRLDLVACLEAVYPLSIFSSIPAELPTTPPPTPETEIADFFDGKLVQKGSLVYRVP